MFSGPTTLARGQRPFVFSARIFSTACSHEPKHQSQAHSEFDSILRRALHTTSSLAAGRTSRFAGRNSFGRRGGGDGARGGPGREPSTNPTNQGWDGEQSPDQGTARSKDLRFEGYKLEELETPGISDKEIEYLKEQVVKKHATPVPFTPREMTPDDLKGLRPEIARDRPGLEETIEAKMKKDAGIRWGEYTHELDFAKRLLRGETVLFESDEHRQKVLAEARRYLSEQEMRKAQKGREREGTEGRRDADEDMEPERLDEERLFALHPPVPVEFQPLEVQQKETMMEMFVRGSYSRYGKGDPAENWQSSGAGPSPLAVAQDIREGGAGVLSAIQAKTRMNETYTVNDQMRLVDKVKKVFEGSGLAITGAAQGTSKAVPAAGSAQD